MENAAVSRGISDSAMRGWHSPSPKYESLKMGTSYFCKNLNHHHHHRRIVIAISHHKQHSGKRYNIPKLVPTTAIIN